MTSNPSTGAHSEAVFRPEIEGLRAIAATLVAVFHIWLHRVSGGVDVFFVVSSFLITTGLVGQIERTGRIHLARVWGRLIKRLVPAAFLVLCTVIVVSVLLLPKSRWKETIEEIAASAAYVENWLLAYHSVDYLAQTDAVSPVQHFWALSVQGQFYILWPLLVVLAAGVAHRLQAAFRQVLLAMLGVVLIASLTFSIYLTWKNQPFAYFNTFARAWEFCIGAALAIVLPRMRLSSVVQIAMGWFGVLAILSCGIVLQVSRVFPGYAALWPTLGAVLVIVAGTTRSPFGVDRLLASKPLIFLGGISYSVYLWHFPLLIFARVVVEPEEITFLPGLGILAASLLLAFVTNRFIENPARRSSFGKEQPVGAFAFGVACAVPLVAGLAAWSVDYLKVRQQDRIKSVSGDRDYPGAVALETGFRYEGARVVPVYPGPLAVADDRPYPQGRDCNQPDEATLPRPCILGDATGRFAIAVVGGSHSAQWLPALLDIAEQSGWRIISFTKSNCPFHSAGSSVGEKEIGSCSEWNENVLREILSLQPDAVFTTSTRFSEGREILPDSYLKAWEPIAAAGIKIIAVRDNPDFGFDVSACVELHGEDSALCSIPRNLMFAEPYPVQLLPNQPENVQFIDLSDYFCDPTVCHPVAGNVMIYRHGNHITATYMHTLAPILKRELLSHLGAKSG